jgi:hypothetical protein
MLALLAGPEKTPAEMNRTLFISFEDEPKNIFVIEKKQQAKVLVIYPIGHSARKF